MRPFPCPYSTMLAICSDIDGTTPDEFEAYHKYLNTERDTQMGQGLGLDVGDSFWMYMGGDSGADADSKGRGQDAVMTWFEGVSDTPKNAKLIAYYFKRGWIDAIHSYGDFSRDDTTDTRFSRALAEQAATALSARDVFPTVWINHGNEANTQNFEIGSRVSYRQGARPGTPFYHADITIPAGIKFIWFSDNDKRFGRHNILYPVTLADGRKVWGFRRYTADWSTHGLHMQLCDANLDYCTAIGAPVIVTQHLGGGSTYHPLGTAARQALLGLAARQGRGEILVARTSRLLEYLRVRDHLVFAVSHGQTVDILGVDDPQLGYDPSPTLDMLRGMTFYVQDKDTASIRVGGEPVDEALLVRAGDETGRDTIGIAWFAPDVRNYLWGARDFRH